jgi:hypothetical protein
MLTLIAAHGAPTTCHLDPLSTKAGYLTHLLINEVAFPGESSYRDEEDSLRCMSQILCVLDNRTRNIPSGYTQKWVAATESRDLIDVITAVGQVEGFCRNAEGGFIAAPRVVARVNRLVRIANQGPPGATARLLNYARFLAREYVENHRPAKDLFAEVSRVGSIEVAGGAYAWMTAAQARQPGGDFIAIPRRLGGVIGGNQFYKLRQKSSIENLDGSGNVASHTAPLSLLASQ